MDKIKLIENQFIQVDNKIVFNSGLSLQALGLYNVIKALSNIPNFELNKQYIRKITGLGIKPFDRLWSELKNAGIILVDKKRLGSKWKYIFKLKKEL